jgi:hypothetical protein
MPFEELLRFLLMLDAAGCRRFSRSFTPLMFSSLRRRRRRQPRQIAAADAHFRFSPDAAIYASFHADARFFMLRDRQPRYSPMPHAAEYFSFTPLRHFAAIEGH